MLTQIQLEDRETPFRLDPANGRWHSLTEHKEGDFPLIARVDGKRFELYSDGTFAEVES